MVTLGEGSKVRTPEGEIGIVVEARNTIWAFTRRVSPEDPNNPGQPLHYGWYNTKLYQLHQLKGV